ncbi:MAG: YfhO family protein [Angelakisella sp.]|nr:YfhO family protein [Angelakisella sp.]
MNLTETPQEIRRRYRQVFLLGLLVATAAFLPYVVYDKGLFLYYGDFNVQQIPFYQLANEAIHNGEIWWSWKTDLGANFLGSYSFYLLFSPFFWISLLFPTAATPYLMAPLLVLKSACAAVTGYMFLRRFVKNQDYAVFCSLLYAFSGFSVYNIFFNHFHEAIVFFPLLLVGLEKAMTERKYGYFALAITVNAVVNYWFFIGEVVFVILYFFVRFTSPEWKLTPRKFGCLAVEAVVGMGLAMVAFLPSVLAIMGNPRTTSDNVLLGNNLWYYSNPQRYLGILHSIFFAPDMPALNNFFPDHGAQWSSLAAYIPLFSASGVLAYCFAKKRDWLRTMLITCAVFAFVPMLNHLFVMMNYSYYTRWFYMPTLLMVLATARALEDCEANGDSWMMKGMRATGMVIILILVMVGLTPKYNDGEWSFGMYKYAEKFLATGAITLVLFLVAVVVIRAYRSHPRYREILFSSILAGCFLFTFFSMLIGKATYYNNRWITQVALPGRDQMTMESETFARSDIYKGNDNLGMYWNLPNIQCFHSVIPASIMEFYPEVGVKRDVSSKPETQYPALRDLLSVRWLYIAETEEDQAPMDGYSYVDNRLGYNIYENQNYIPMGFAYTMYFDDSEMEYLSSENKSRAMLRAVYLEEDAILRHQDILEYIDTGWLTTSEDRSQDVEERRAMACQSFEIDDKGFTATTSFDRDRLVFFSVPYDKGWKATINGEPALVEKANIGFMAVRVPAGSATIRFEYTPPGLWFGAIISVVSLILLLCYLLVMRRMRPEADYLVTREGIPGWYEGDVPNQPAAMDGSMLPQEEEEDTMQPEEPVDQPHEEKEPHDNDTPRGEL